MPSSLASLPLQMMPPKPVTGFSGADYLGRVINSGAAVAELDTQAADLCVGYVLPAIASNSLISCTTGSLGRPDFLLTALTTLGSNLKTTSGISNFDCLAWTTKSSQTFAVTGMSMIVGSPPDFGAPDWLPKTRIESLIEAEKQRVHLPPEAIATAEAASDQARLVVRRERLRGNPSVMISDDGILSLVWESGDLGAALLFYGDGTMSLASRTPNQFYSEGGMDLAVSDPIPTDFKILISKLNP
jgi:hypothetical protein